MVGRGHQPSVTPDGVTGTPVRLVAGLTPTRDDPPTLSAAAPAGHFA